MGCPLFVFLLIGFDLSVKEIAMLQLETSPRAKTNVNALYHIEQSKSSFDIAVLGSYSDGALRNIPIVPQRHAVVNM